MSTKGAFFIDIDIIRILFLNHMCKSLLVMHVLVVFLRHKKRKEEKEKEKLEERTPD